MDAEVMNQFFELKLLLKDYAHEIEDIQKDVELLFEDAKDMKEYHSKDMAAIWIDLKELRDRLPPLDSHISKSKTDGISLYDAVSFIYKWFKKWSLLIAAISGGIIWLTNYLAGI